MISLHCVINPFALRAEPALPETNSLAGRASDVDFPKSTIWQSDIGEGFLSTAETFSLEAGIALGMATLGSQQAHDFALLSISYGRILGQVTGQGHWYRGNFEGRLELFGGAQYSPLTEWVIGLTPHLRYDFATGTRWIPFIDAGVGVTVTSIGSPDLSSAFEFNLKATAGLHWVLDHNLALTSEISGMHMSDAGIHQPNHGVNNVIFMVGLTWFFGK